MINQDTWFIKISELVRFASKGTSLSEFKNYGLMQAEPGLTYSDWVAALEWLISQNLVFLDGNFMRLSKLQSIPEWLEPSLLEGDEAAWSVFKDLDQYGKLQWKFDTEALSDLGLAGEKYVVEVLKSQIPEKLHSQILHVSLQDDSLGYDIACPDPANLESILYLEVKTSSRPRADFTFFLSRNEFNVSRKPEWRLVMVKKENKVFQLLGTLTKSSFSSLVPREVDSSVRWESIKVNWSGPFSYSLD